MSTALLIGVLSFGINSAADAQIGTIQLSPNVGLDFSTSGWTPLGYGIDPYSPTGSTHWGFPCYVRLETLIVRGDVAMDCSLGV